MARNLLDLLPLVDEHGPGRIAFCTDDRDPDDIADDGHVNGMVRKAVAAGIAPEDALVMASLHPALWHGLRRHGAIAPGYRADLLVLPDLVELRARDRAQARPAARGHAARRDSGLGAAERAHAARLRRATSRSRSDGASVRAIGLVEDQVVTESVVREPAWSTGGGRGPRRATSRRSPSSSATSRPGGSASASSPAPASSAARSPRRSRTTPTTSSSSA